MYTGMKTKNPGKRLVPKVTDKQAREGYAALLEGSKDSPRGKYYRDAEWLKLGNQILKARPGSPMQRALIEKRAARERELDGKANPGYTTTATASPFYTAGRRARKDYPNLSADAALSTWLGKKHPIDRRKRQDILEKTGGKSGMAYKAWVDGFNGYNDITRHEVANPDPALLDIAQRMNAAEDHLVSLIMEQGYTRDQAVRILNVWQHLKLLKRSGIGKGGLTVKHGGYWDRPALDNALQYKLPEAAERRLQDALRSRLGRANPRHPRPLSTDTEAALMHAYAEYARLLGAWHNRDTNADNFELGRKLVSLVEDMGWDDNALPLDLRSGDSRGTALNPTWPPNPLDDYRGNDYRIAFTIDKRGKKIAYREDVQQGRNFRIGLEDAELLIATGRAKIVPYHSFTAASYQADYAKAEAAKKQLEEWTPQGKANPESTAADLYEEFHGRPSTEIIEVETLEHHHDYLAVLGELVEITIELLEGDHAGKLYQLTFDGCGVFLAASEDRTTLYIKGGDQSLPLDSMGLGDPTLLKDSMVIGYMRQITYQTQKAFDDFATIDYYHKAGEETGQLPILLYAPSKSGSTPALSLSGGAYEIKDVGITN